MIVHSLITWRRYNGSAMSKEKELLQIELSAEAKELIEQAAAERRMSVRTLVLSALAEIDEQFKEFIVRDEEETG